ncbi:MAG TPA: lipoyl(octanoyl) transferase LipB [Thermoanaerobaculia bacterium]|nr:lipoyl(octanoyl) transferase LipB [Thermoanaerobaculia bacterium]
MTRLCELRELHRVTYENGMIMQEFLVAARQRDEIADQLLLLEHPPVITLGRGGRIQHLLATDDRLRDSGVRFYETTRGGDITYHGPGQLVGYPILHLGEGNRDVRKLVWRIEEVLIRTAAELGIVAQRVEGRRGIWVGDQKLAAIGVRIARWVTSHGFALNLTTDLRAFDLITPCGLEGTGVTSIRELTGYPVTRGEITPLLTRHFAEVFEREVEPRDDVFPIVKVLPHDGQRVLLLERTREKGAFWQPVTGRMEGGETVEQAAARELAEETGCAGVMTPLPPRQSFLIEGRYLPELGVPWVFADERTFAARLSAARPPGRATSGSLASHPTPHAARDDAASRHAGGAARYPVRLAPEEHLRYGWFTLSEAREKIRGSNDRESLDSLERMIQQTRREVREGAAAGGPLPAMD